MGMRFLPMTGTTVDTPVRFDVSTYGALSAPTRQYVKKLGDMDGVYLDAAAWRQECEARGTDAIVYRVDEHKYNDNPGSLIVGTSTLLPGLYGNEFAVTRGHLHRIADRAELYYCLSGHGLLLLETTTGNSQAVELRPGQATTVPGHWIHRSVNVGDEPFVTLFCYSADAGQDYAIISEAGGMKSLVVSTAGGWSLVDNPRHTGYLPEEDS